MTILLTMLALTAALHAAARLAARRRRRPLPQWVSSLLLCIYSLVAVLLALELYFAYLHDQSDGYNLTYAGRKWQARHWGPLNELGYRDVPFAPPRPDQRVIVFLGDSFAAGHGIDDPHDRFSDVFATLAGAGWRVYNVAKLGWDTLDEHRALAGFPVKPEVVVLAYYVNDIYHAAQAVGFPLPFTVNMPFGTTKMVLDDSALADFVYWRLARLGNIRGGDVGFWHTLRAAYADERVWAEHCREIDLLVDYCQGNGIELVCLVFPMLQAVEQSGDITRQVAAKFRSRGVAALDLGVLLRGARASDLVVNGIDAHPSRMVHRGVGMLVYDLLGGPGSRLASAINPGRCSLEKAYRVLMAQSGGR